MTDERRYDDREVGLILERVAELHQERSDKVDSRAMTRGEIEHVVTELGISKALVSRAVSELSVQDLRNRSVWYLGGRTDLMFEQTVPGRVDDATLTRMLEVLRRSLADPGKLEETGASRIWTTTEGTRRVHLSLVEHEDSTTVRLEERMPADSRALVGMATGMGGFAGIMASIPLKVLLGKALLLLMLGPTVLLGAMMGWLVGRALWGRISGRREDQLRRAYGELLALAEAPRALPEGDD